jgi:uncharacterized glyoxalase superfamily protein PhnB
MAVNPIPQGYATVTPWIIPRDTAALIDFMKRASGAEELACLTGEDGTVAHAEVRVGDSVVMMFDARPVWPHTRQPVLDPDPHRGRQPAGA